MVAGTAGKQSTDTPASDALGIIIIILTKVNHVSLVFFFAHFPWMAKQVWTSIGSGAKELSQGRLRAVLMFMGRADVN